MLSVITTARACKGQEGTENCKKGSESVSKHLSFLIQKVALTNDDMAIVNKDFIGDALNAFFNGINESGFVFNVPDTNRTRFTFAAKKVKDDELFVIPINFEVIVDAKFSEVTHFLFNFIQV